MGFQRDAGDSAGLRGRGEGLDAERAERDCGGAAGRVTIDVTGLDEFDITDFSTEANDAKSLLDLGIDSPTLKKQIS